MRSLLLISALIAATSAFQVSDDVWGAWKAKYNKNYNGDAVYEATRRANWNVNAERVMLHNLEYSLGMHTYDQEMNFLQDMSHEEYVSTMLMNNMPEPVVEFDAEHTHEMLPETPSSINWVNKGKVTSVKNQGSCGSCWSFSASGALESAHAIAGYSLISLSEQELVSCDTYDDGCGGGWYYNAWYWLEQQGGQISESSYPYVDGNGATYSCQKNGKSVAAKIQSYKCTSKGSESSLENAVGNMGPTSVAIDAALSSFGSYKSGIYNPTGCNGPLDHAVLTVGYDSNSQGQYWIVKNSWGTSWGQAGYFWMAKGHNECGILNGPPCYPTV